VEKRALKHEVRRAARGDEDAAALLFDHYYPRVYRYAVVRLGEQHDAEDVAAETFARILRGLDGFKWQGGGFEAWLFRIVANLVVDHFRHRSHEVVDEIDDDPAATDELPEVRAIQSEQAGEMAALLDGLPSEQREVLVLRFAACLDTNQAADVMKKRVNAVRQLQFRALENLRKKVRP
jgi:RNA polymerase sigma-70 factor (ECF subfamily)